jgi:hypothetical protein
VASHSRTVIHHPGHKMDMTSRQTRGPVMVAVSIVKGAPAWGGSLRPALCRDLAHAATEQSRSAGSEFHFDFAMVLSTAKLAEGHGDKPVPAPEAAGAVHGWDTKCRPFAAFPFPTGFRSNRVDDSDGT